MAVLACDICGGKLVMRTGGIAVCDSCGMEHSKDRMQEKVFYIKSLQADVEGLLDRTSDDMKKLLKDLAETIRYSDPMSSPQLAAIENKIEAKAAGLTEAVDRADGNAIKALCDELQQLFAERNRKCKVLK